jgi:CBS domain-containing protein
MTQVSELMAKEVYTVREETPIGEAAKLLLEKHINGLPVIDEENNLVGILCQSDLVTQQKRLPIPSVFTLLDGLIPLRSSTDIEKEVKKIAATTVGDAMTPEPTTVSPDTPLEEAATIMVKKNYHTLPVVEEGKLVGILGKEDVLKTLI